MGQFLQDVKNHILANDISASIPPEDLKKETHYNCISLMMGQLAGRFQALK